MIQRQKQNIETYFNILHYMYIVCFLNIQVSQGVKISRFHHRHIAVLKIALFF